MKECTLLIRRSDIQGFFKVGTWGKRKWKMNITTL